MIIRPAQETDVDAIGLLWRELVDYHRQLDDNMPIAAEDGHIRYAQRMSYTISDTTAQIYVAEVDGKIVGYVFGTVIELLPETFIDETAGMIGDIYVQANHRGTGIGTALMQAMKDWFKLRGIEHYEWYVASANKAGIAFWEKSMNGVSVMVRMRAPID